MKMKQSWQNNSRVVWEIPGSNLGYDTGYLSGVNVLFSQSLQANGGRVNVPQTGHDYSLNHFQLIIPACSLHHLLLVRPFIVFLKILALDSL